MDKFSIQSPGAQRTVIEPQDRIAIVGKTGSGKTTFAMLLAALWARSLPAPWQVWWLDTKGDKKDIAALRAWGFRNALDPKDLATTKIPHARYWAIRAAKNAPSIWQQAQVVMRLAYETGKVIVVVDEYTQVVPSNRSTGGALRDIFTRGRGLDVGIIGLTQEPVYVPRLLLSQATHQVLFTVTYQYDVDYLRKMDRGYREPIKLGDKHGFWWKWVDGHGELVYYRNQQAWYESFYIGLPKSARSELPETPAGLKRGSNG